MNREYSGLGLAGLFAVAATSPYILQHDPYGDLRDIRRIIGPKCKKAYRPRYRRATKTTHRRDRVNVAARRRANVQRLRQARGSA